MVITDLEMEDKTGLSRFFQKTFLVIDTKFEAVLEMSFLKISNANMLFSEGAFIWKSYTTNKALSTTKQIQIADLKKFVIAAFDVSNKTFVMHIAI